MSLNPLLPFLMAGDPSLEVLPELLAEARTLGLPALELGLPHSDPIADGRVLQAAAHRAIARGATPLKVLERLAGIRESPDLILFTYLNPLLQIGATLLQALLVETPVKALLVVDLPPGEAPELEEPLRRAGYPVIPLIAPTTTAARARTLCAARPDPGPEAPFAQRFVYVVARLGVTGLQGSADLASLGSRLREIRGPGDRPLAVGFGLSRREELSAIRGMGATPVVGSAAVAALAEGKSLREILGPLL